VAATSAAPTVSLFMVFVLSSLVIRAAQRLHAQREPDVVQFVQEIVFGHGAFALPVLGRPDRFRFVVHGATYSQTGVVVSARRGSRRKPMSARVLSSSSDKSR
jgi:hypothetical protein